MDGIRYSPGARFSIVSLASARRETNLIQALLPQSAVEAFNYLLVMGVGVVNQRYSLDGSDVERLFTVQNLRSLLARWKKQADPQRRAFGKCIAT